MARVTEESLNKKRNSFDMVYKSFLDRGLKLIDKKYINSNTKMKCVDENGYLFSVSYSAGKPPVKSSDLQSL